MAVIGGIWFLLLSAACIVALYFFVPGAPTFYLLVIALSIVIAPCFDVYVRSGWSKLINDLSGLVEAFILFAVFFTPLKDFFSRNGAAESGRKLHR